MKIDPGSSLGRPPIFGGFSFLVAVRLVKFSRQPVIGWPHRNFQSANFKGSYPLQSGTKSRWKNEGAKDRFRPGAAIQRFNIDGITPDVAHNVWMVFEYLTVLISVVVGLSVTSFLTNVARIIHVRGAVTISWVQLLWSIVILIWTIAFWWFTFVLAEQPEWTFPLFVFLLVYSTLLFFMMALLFPEGMPADHNYRAQFMRNRVWFFGVLLLFLCVDLIDYIVKLEKDVSIVGHLPYAAFVGPLIVLSLLALRTENLLFHRIFAVYSLLAILVMSVTTLLPLAT